MKLTQADHISKHISVFCFRFELSAFGIKS